MKKVSLISLHKKLGLSSMIIIFILVITGLLLNHTEELSLDKKKAGSSLLNSWYGIKVPKASEGLKYDLDWVAQVADKLFIEEKQVKGLIIDELLGAKKSPFGWLVATNNSLILISHKAELIDIVHSHLPIKHSFLYQQKMFLKLQDNKYYQFPPPYEKLQHIDFTETDIEQQYFMPLPYRVKSMINKQLQKEGLTLERVVLDIHSGRFFGKFGVYVVDFFSVLFLMLSITGLWMFLKQSKREKRNSNETRKRKR